MIADATGRLVQLLPPGEECDRFLRLVRIGVKFRQQQHAGRRPGPLANEVAALCRESARPMTFDRLLYELDGHLADGFGCVTALNRVRKTLDYADRGQTFRVKFSTLRNALTQARKKLPTSDSREPLNHERGM